MTQTHTSYKVSKAIKEFLGKDAPIPMRTMLMAKSILIYSDKGVAFPIEEKYLKDDDPFAYCLHDLLSKPFCEAMAENIGQSYCGFEIAEDIMAGYYRGGLPAVEKELIKMMEGK